MLEKTLKENTASKASYLSLYINFIHLFQSLSS